MKLAHSFFIAEEKYCTDKAKLLLYLQEKIEVGMMCILCENKGAKDFTTGDSVKQHMLSKNHTFMKTEGGFEEYEDFYDFSELFKQKLEEQKLYATPVGINFEKVKVIVDDKDAKAKPQKKGNEDQM
jgi:pre-60S factor REI1